MAMRGLYEKAAGLRERPPPVIQPLIRLIVFAVALGVLPAHPAVRDVVLFGEFPAHASVGDLFVRVFVLLGALGNAFGLALVSELVRHGLPPRLMLSTFTLASGR
jgi:hypothetical protein